MKCKCPARCKEKCQNNNDGTTCSLLKRIEEAEKIFKDLCDRKLNKAECTTHSSCNNCEIFNFKEGTQS